MTSLDRVIQTVEAASDSEITHAEAMEITAGMFSDLTSAMMFGFVVWIMGVVGMGVGKYAERFSDGLSNPGCGKTCRPLFEEAAKANHEESGDVAVRKLDRALSALYECKGIEYDVLDALSECERWFSFFNLWWSARLIEKGKVAKAIVIMEDQAESYSPARAKSLGILADYGEVDTARLYSLTKEGLNLAKAGDTLKAVAQADTAANLQYELAVKRAGTQPPRPQEE